ncbi:MAG: hypothetical protein KC636_31625 [Myxococcales bacterium]|nr:hypothetical protein [Myxococcales bacterium]
MTVIAPAPQGFERSPMPGTTRDDLDNDALQAFLERRAPALVGSIGGELVAARLGLLGSSAGKLIPTVAGLYVFGLHPQLVRPEWGMSAVRVEGRVLSDPIRLQRDIEGNLGAMIDAALEFVRDNTRSIVNEADPEQSAVEYPEIAVREAVINALIHRDLRMPGRVALRVFDDRMEIWNPGGLTAAILLEEQAQHGGVSLPRNPLLAATARALGLVEQIGRGLPTIRRSIARTKGAHIQIYTTQTDVRVILPSGLYTPPGGHADH